MPKKSGQNFVNILKIINNLLPPNKIGSKMLYFIQVMR